jgi:hypothetical protein
LGGKRHRHRDSQRGQAEQPWTPQSPKSAAGWVAGSRMTARSVVGHPSSSMDVRLLGRSSTSSRSFTYSPSQSRPS